MKRTGIIMFPSELISACAVFGGVCITACIALFHYFKDRVDNYVNERTILFFSKKETLKVVKELSRGSLSSIISEDFYNELNKIREPKHRLKRTILTLPVTGFLFIVSAITGSLSFVESEIIRQIEVELEILADMTLAFSVILLIYTIVQLVRLSRKLV